MQLPDNSEGLGREAIVKMLYLVSGWISSNKTHNELTVIELDRLALEIHDNV